jgi:glycerate 2-kinase
LDPKKLKGSGTGGPAHLRVEAVEIFRGAIRAVDPAELVAQYLSSHAAREHMRAPTLVVGAGKAAARMSAGCEAVLGSDSLRGEVVVANGCGVPLRAIRVSEAGHPLPDARGEEATHRIVQSLRAHDTGDVLCLISGGASSLLVSPQAPVTLQDKIATTRLLLDCGADIRAFNTVRKHLSRVKGGGLLRLGHGRMLALLLSDAVGDDPSTIGSGPTAPDDTTFAGAWEVLTRYDLTSRVPATVANLVQSGIAGRVPETVKSNTPEAARCRNVIVGSNRTAVEGAAAAARSNGWMVHVEDTPLTGDTTVSARGFAARVRVISEREHDKRLCILAGGETTVRVLGGGRGGRNQEFALAMAPALAGTSISVLSAGTDGIDGPTDAAGAFVDGTTLRRAKERGLDVDAALHTNDSYTFFSHLGDLFRCGPTATNVMDIKIALVPAGGASAS